MEDHAVEERDRLRAERDQLLRELEDIRVRLGGAPNSKLDGEDGLAAATMRDRDRLASMEEIARKFHDVAVRERDLARAQLAAVSMERDSIRTELEARVAKVEAERGEARAQVSELLPEADPKQHFATRSLRVEEKLGNLRRELQALLDSLESIRASASH